MAFSPGRLRRSHRSDGAVRATIATLASILIAVLFAAPPAAAQDLAAFEASVTVHRLDVPARGAANGAGVFRHHPNPVSVGKRTRFVRR